MRLVKAFLVGAIGLFVIITLFSLLIPFHVKVSRATIINNVPTDKVYQQIAVLQNWKNWQPLFKDEAATINFADNGCMVVYNNKLTRLSVIGKDSSRIKFTLESAGENDIYNEIVITPLTSQNAIQVEWQSNTKLHWYPWEKFYAIFIDKLSGPGYETALKNLKDFLEMQH